MISMSLVCDAAVFNRTATIGSVHPDGGSAKTHLLTGGFMNRVFQVALLLAASLNVHASEEEKFQRCVQLKDLTLAIAQQADQGTTRSKMKAKVSSSSAEPLIDFVYDFRGVKSNQQIAANQMENCLRLSGIKAKRQ